MCCVSNELVNLNGRDCKKTKAINTHSIFVRVMYFFIGKVSIVVINAPLYLMLYILDLLFYTMFIY